MEIDRIRHTFAKLPKRNRSVFVSFRTAALALVLGFTSISASAQQTTGDSGRSASARGTTQQSAPQPTQQNTVPGTLILPEGMAIQVRTTDYLSNSLDSGHFIGVLFQPIVLDGWVVARAGQYMVGEMSNAGKKSAVQLSLSQLMLADGEVLRIQTPAINASTDTAPLSLLTFNLAQAVSFTTARGAVAFHAVSPEDYTNFPLGNAPVQLPNGYDPPCCVDQNGNGAFAGDGYGYPYYYGAGYFPPPIQIRYYGWHGTRWGW